MTVLVDRPDDLDRAAVLAVAQGARVELSADLLERLAARRRAALAALGDGPDVYGVTTGMGALSDTRLSVEAQADHSRRLMLARAVGGPPWLSRTETRALLAVRLRTFLSGDAAVSPELCAWLGTLLEHDVLPAVPRTGSGAAGEILPMAHAWGHLAGVGRVLAADGSAVPAGPVVDPLSPPRLGPKEGIALLAGVPTATALAVLLAADVRRLVSQSTAVAAAGIVLMGVTRDPYLPAVARGDDEQAEVLTRLAAYVGPLAAPRHLQAPVSFRVAGPVLAHLLREGARLDQVADRALQGVGDSPAYLTTHEGERFVGTAGFHGLDQAAGLDSARTAVVHAATVGAARLHRMLDPGTSGLPAQLSADPGPQAGLTPVHKRAVAVVHEVSGWPATFVSSAETSQGQEDVQTFALEAAERLRLALDAAEQVLACELLALHQARLLAPERMAAARGGLPALVEQVADVLPPGTEDRPWGEDVERLRALLRSGWALDPSSP
ncbi:aromatic amino acid lyase [Nocardioides sp. 503]|uniref:aromatic amino acid lyase n=1 Tax=Nocardioides sp. 503 TaxID=2508326 RepID=UPI001FD693D4|nr:aromatic amino acid lyase [Nocardioides sp. 503]